MNDGKDFPKDFLKSLYQSIKSKKLEWAVDEEELQKSIMPMSEDTINITGHNRQGSPFLEVPQDHKAPTYKQGFLSRKFHADIDGKKTPWGKRSWKTFYAVLKGTIIYLLKDEYRPDKQSSEEAISIHHSLATKAAEYNKRPHVFRLQTADWRIFLFQAQSAEQMNSWITRINLVAAMFSSPPFPAAIGSKRKFSRPIYPATVSKQSEEAQLESHDSMLQSILDDLDDHQLNVPDKKSKAKEFEEYKMKQEYLNTRRFISEPDLGTAQEAHNLLGIAVLITGKIIRPQRTSRHVISPTVIYQLMGALSATHALQGPPFIHACAVRAAVFSAHASMFERAESSTEGFRRAGPWFHASPELTGTLVPHTYLKPKTGDCLAIIEDQDIP
ncbi:PH and SEC7 domain-containing protein 3-like [Pristis pectinata]|uniref:PH and SEC7 domain-containing protein 3-like n=1 Tax=Pristis pectinata TaxID=685728 RepID=UPI00223D6B6D|nr:PH and SEC7 domain-containing protein 3-like [Pristis pectinata]